MTNNNLYQTESHVKVDYTDADLFNLFANGDTLRDLSAKTNYTPAYLARRLKSYDADGYAMYSALHRRANFDESKATRLRERGYSLRAISDAVGVPRSTLGDYFKQMGISKKVTKK